MYRVKKVLNHNAVLLIETEEKREYLAMGKGLGFGRKVSEYVEIGPEDTLYSLQEMTERGNAQNIVLEVAPVCLELADAVLKEAEKTFGKIDRTILFPMADHIAYAVKRVRNQEQISNPLTEDIRILFYREYKVAQCIEPLLWEKLGIRIEEDEIGYVALHVHSAIEEEKVSQAMQTARAVRECITLVEAQCGKKIDVMSLSYNRLMNHVRYMVTRAMRGEHLKLNMNDYMKLRFPESFASAAVICRKVGESLKCTLDEVETGYLAMHIERVAGDEKELV